jgi:hypothetical protein
MDERQHRAVLNTICAGVALQGESPAKTSGFASKIRPMPWTGRSCLSAPWFCYE